MKTWLKPIQSLCENMVQFIEKIHGVNKKRLMTCCIAALALVVFGYFWNNLQVFTGEDSRMLVKIEHVLNVTLPQWLGLEIRRDTTECEDVIFVNTSFDKELIHVHEEDNKTPIGNTDIVNRETLYKFLKVLKDEEVDYKYIVLDIDFSYKSHKKVLDTVSGDSVEIDELLFGLIDSMERVIVAMPKSGSIDNRLRRKAALADYTATIVSPKFVRYKYQDSIPYIPLAIYNPLQKQEGEDTIACCYSLLEDEGQKKLWYHSFIRNLPFLREPLRSISVYEQGGKLCNNSLFIPFSLSDSIQIEDNSLNLGSILSNLKGSIDGLCKDKYVFIGDMKISDMHTTYLGRRPGSYILYKALKELEAGKHQVPLGMMAFLFVVYVWMIYRMLSGKNSVAISYLRKIDNPFLKLLADVCTFSVVFMGIHIFEYLIYKGLYSFTLPITFFTFLKFYMLMKTSAKTGKCKMLKVIAYAVLATLLFSFMSPPSEKRDLVVLRDAKNVYIVIGGQEVRAKQGLKFSRTNTIKFRDRNEGLHVINVGDDFIMRGEIWKRNKSKELRVKERRVIINASWWLVTKPTLSKGADDFEGHHYLAGGFITFPVDSRGPSHRKNNPIFYRLIRDESKHKGDTIWLNNDSTDPVVWLHEDSLKKKINLKDGESYRFKVEKYYASGGEYVCITDSCIVEYIK